MLKFTINYSQLLYAFFQLMSIKETNNKLKKKIIIIVSITQLYFYINYIN